MTQPFTVFPFDMVNPPPSTKPPSEATLPDAPLNVPNIDRPANGPDRVVAPSTVVPSPSLGTLDVFWKRTSSGLTAVMAKLPVTLNICASPLIVVSNSGLKPAAGGRAEPRNCPVPIPKSFLYARGRCHG